MTAKPANERDAASQPPASQKPSSQRRSPQANAQWELEVGPRRIKIVAWLLAIMIVVVFIVLALLLRIEETGVYFQTADQVGVALIGVLIAGAFLLFTRPRLRAGERGVTVRNLFGDKLIEWDLVLDLAFPEGAAWARLELPDEEYVPVLAIQIYDRMRAVEAVRDFRAVAAKYAPAPPA